MKYTKPEVSTLGDAKTAIEYNGIRKPVTPLTEPPLFKNAPAYDLDE
jgi:hypothetical protein